MTILDMSTFKLCFTQDGTVTARVIVAQEGMENEEGTRTIISCELKDYLEKLVCYRLDWA